MTPPTHKLAKLSKVCLLTTTIARSSARGRVCGSGQVGPVGEGHCRSPVHPLLNLSSVRGGFTQVFFSGCLALGTGTFLGACT